jgi:hypothetical protein
MASTEERILYTVAIQCGNKIFHWDEYVGDLHEVIEPKSLEEIADAMQMKKPMKAKQFHAII